MSSDDKKKEEEKPPVVHYPADYVVPDVWTFEPQEGTMGGMNRPTAGARKEQNLPRGKHDLQLYSLGTPNGMKVTILLEELNDVSNTEIDYDAWKISIFDLDQFGSDFVAINPNSKIPALLDYNAFGAGEPLRVFESGNILKYVAEKFEGQHPFLPSDPRAKVECFNWLFWQMGSAPYLGGGFGHFYKYAPLKIEYAIDRFTMETKRQLDVLDKQLEGQSYIVKGYDESPTIADFAIFPWIYCVQKFYDAEEFLQLDSYKNVMRWMKTMGDRPAVQRGMKVNGFGDGAIAERHSRADFDKKEEDGETKD